MLARWARDFEVDCLALDLADLEDFRTWIRTVGGDWMTPLGTSTNGDRERILAVAVRDLAEDVRVRRNPGT